MAVPITGDVVALFLLVIGAIGTFWWRIERRLSDQDTARAALQRELAEYKLFVATNHVSASVLKDTEIRLIGAIDKLADRLEAIATRLEERTRP